MRLQIFGVFQPPAHILKPGQEFDPDILSAPQKPGQGWVDLQGSADCLQVGDRRSASDLQVKRGYKVNDEKKKS